MERDIRELDQNLKSVILHFTTIEFKKAMTKHEYRKTPRFKYFQILSNKIEEVIHSTKNMWKTIFEVDNKRDKNVAQSVQTIEDSNSEIQAAEVIASIPTSLNQAIVSSSENKDKIRRKKIAPHPPK